jgi:hypothetical protein
MPGLVATGAPAMVINIISWYFFMPLLPLPFFHAL